jgi:methylmalonyl-CoA mutase
MNKLFEEFLPIDKATWHAQVLKDLKGKDFDTLLWHTSEGIKLQPYYTSEDLETIDFASIQATQRVDNDWLSCPLVIFDTEKNTNQALKNALQNGADSVIVSFGNQDIEPINFSKLLDGIKLSDTPIFFKIKDNSVLVLDKLLTFIPYQMKGGFFYDPFGEWTTTGHWASNTWETVSQNIQKSYNSRHFRTLTLGTHQYHNAGANAVQELAFLLASVVEYFDNMTDLGWKIPELTENLNLSIAVGTNYFVEIAKLRALRVLYAQVVEAFFDGTTVYDLSAHIHAQTSSYFSAAITPNTNMLRATTEAMSAVLGGCDVLTVDAFDAIGDNSSLGQRTARNISTILKEESHLNKTTDPSAGSYFIENLTHQLCEKTWELFQQVERQGGIKAAFENGFIQEQIEENYQNNLEKLQSNQKIMVGVNKFRFDEKPFEAPKATAEYSTDLRLLPQRRISEVFEV